MQTNIHCIDIPQKVRMYIIDAIYKYIRLTSIYKPQEETNILDV